MIYNRDESEVTTLGEVEKHSVSIDAKNINHIVTILSSNLYSYPMISFLRETVSNAVDSHVEAGVSEPIIITRTKSDISIRDFGTGISPERFENIYLNIGSSTKRESNDYIGSFGIGRFSCLSVSKIANITSYYEGTAYFYVMNMDIDQLHIDKIYEMPTTEHNGVEVKIPISSFKANDLDCLSFIDNLYIECTDDDINSYAISQFNKRKILSYNSFKAIYYEYNHGNDKTEILLGKIPYAVDYFSLWDYNDKWHQSWKDTMKSVYPCINIGEVDITPNRESLIYTDRTKERLREAYDACITELTELWNKQCDEEYDNFLEWAEAISAWRINLLKLGDLSIKISDEMPFNAKFKDHPKWDSIDPKEKKKLVGMLYNTSLDTLGNLYNNTLYKGRRDLHITIKKLASDWLGKLSATNRMVLVVPAQTGFSSKYFKNYLSSKYGNKNIIFLRRQKISNYEMKSYIRKIYGTSMFTDKTYLPFVISLLKECYKAIRDRSIYEDIINSEEYKKYKKDHQDPKSYVARHTGKIIFTIINTSYYNSRKASLTLDELLTMLKTDTTIKGNRVVYSQLDNPFLAAFHKMVYPNLIILSTAKNNLKYLEEGLPDYIRPIEELYSKDNRVLIKYKTAKYIKDYAGIEFNTFPIWSAGINKRIAELQSLIDKYDIQSSNNNYPYVDASTILDIIPNDSFDSYMMGEFNELLPYLKQAFALRNNLNLYTGQQADFKYYILMKAKKIHPCYTYYIQMKDRINQIINAYENSQM